MNQEKKNELRFDLQDGNFEIEFIYKNSSKKQTKAIIFQ